MNECSTDLHLSIGAFIREKETLNTSGRKKRMRELLRTPACIGLLQAFRRDLEDIDYASASLAVTHSIFRLY